MTASACAHALCLPYGGCQFDSEHPAPRRVRTQAERAGDDHTWRAPASFQVVYEPPTPVKADVHTCDLPSSPSALFAADLELPKPRTVVRCTECGQRWIADYHSHVQIWSPAPRRRWWHRLTRRNP